MKNIVSKQHGRPSNCPTDGDVFTKMLEAMTEEELTDGLNEALETMTEENYDSALIDAYLAALDRKAPMPEVPDTDTSFANFKNRLLLTFPAEKVRDARPRRRVQSIWRAGLIAALTIICLMGGMVVAQAAGVDVFGAIARWTDEVFSFGAIQSDGVEDVPIEATEKNTDTGGANELRYESLQEALNAFTITEFSEPSWIPNGYELRGVTVDCWPDGGLIYLSAEYLNYNNSLLVEIKNCQGEPRLQIEKTDTPVETFVVNGLTVYLLENVNNTMAAWVTDHYECYIGGTVDRNQLQQIVKSVYANLQ